MTQLGPDYWLSNGLARHTLEPPQGLIECATVLDVGAGIRPFHWYTPSESHICVDPYLPYVEKLRAAGFEVIHATATKAFADDIRAEAIYLLDVIEHMYKAEAAETIDLAVAAASRQVVIYTPNGFMEQDKDDWGLGGDFWQTHRSGWLPGEFPGWHTEMYGRGFFAVLTK